MIFGKTAIQGVFLVELERNEDARGCFARSFCESEFSDAGFPFHVSQANLSKSRGKGTVRGMHYQTRGIHEAKVVRCIRGAVWDVVVDMREGSPTKFKHIAFELSDANGLALCIPDGVAHGHQALTDEADLFYLMDGSYLKGHEAGLRYDDPAIGIRWPLPLNRISRRDLAWPLLGVE
jgi:dTDP-4-dehydrorhamnose 3,5-epimerase